MSQGLGGRGPLGPTPVPARALLEIPHGLDRCDLHGADTGGHQRPQEAGRVTGSGGVAPPGGGAREGCAWAPRGKGLNSTADETLWKKSGALSADTPGFIHQQLPTQRAQIATLERPLFRVGGVLERKLTLEYELDHSCDVYRLHRKNQLLLGTGESVLLIPIPMFIIVSN